MFGEKNAQKFLKKYKDIFGFSIDIEWCTLRRKNRLILLANPGCHLKDQQLYQNMLAFVVDCERQHVFKRVEFLGVFPDPEDNVEMQFLNEYWVLKLTQDTRNRHMFQDKHGNLIIAFI